MVELRGEVLKGRAFQVASRGCGRQSEEEELEPTASKSESSARTLLKSSSAALAAGQAGTPGTPLLAASLPSVSSHRRSSVTSWAVERGSGTEHDATEGSSLTLVASGSFVTNEPLLVPVEGVVKSAFGGVKPATDILATPHAKVPARTQSIE